MTDLLAICESVLASLPEVQLQGRAGGAHLTVQVQEGQQVVSLAVFDRGEGWLSMVSLVVDAQTDGPLEDELLRNSLMMSEETGICRFLIADEGLWLRTDCLPHPDIIRYHLQHLSQAQAALLRGEVAAAFSLAMPDGPAPREAVAALVAGLPYSTAWVEALSGWRIDESDENSSRPMIARWAPGQGAIRLYLGLHQIDTAAPHPGLVRSLLLLNDRTQLGRCTLMEELGLILVAMIPLVGLDGEGLAAAITQLWADAATVHESLSPAEGDVGGQIRLMRRWLEMRQAEEGFSEAQLAGAILASARGNPVDEPFSADPMLRRVVAEAGHVLLAELPRRNPAAVLLLMMGLELAQSGSRSMEEVWDLALSYAE